jgi:hypothetical protein
MSENQYATPVIIRNNKTTPLFRVEFGDRSHNERWIQKLLFEHPELIPFNELDEPAFDGSVPIAREVGTKAGAIDVLYANSSGLLTVVETKLWRNPQARREVIAQLIDYASCLSEMSYDDLAKAVGVAIGSNGNALVEKICKNQPSFNETRFHDAVSRNLKSGRFLLLVVGDGIHEGVELMAEFLQGKPNLGFTLRLVEMTLFRVGHKKSKEILVQPRIVAKTAEVVRAIVEVSGNNVFVRTPPVPPKTSGARYRISEQQFYDELAKKTTPDAVNFVRKLLQEAKEEHGLTVDWKQAGPLLKFVHPESGRFFTLGQIDRYGKLSSLVRLFQRCRKLKLPEDIWKDYFKTITGLIPDAYVDRGRSQKEGDWEDVAYKESARPLESLMSKKSDWFLAIDRTVKRIKDEMSKRGTAYTRQ